MDLDNESLYGDNGVEPTNPPHKDAEADDETVVQGNMPQPLEYTRCDMKIVLTSSTDDNYLAALKNIQSFFTKVTKEDETAVIAPWKENNPSELIMSPNDIPSNEDDAEDYFKGLNPRDDREGSQDLWFKIRIGHTVPILTIQQNISRFMNRNKWRLSTLMLQVEDVVCVGFLQYSDGRMDFKNLAAAIENQIGFPVQLRWRIISKGWSKGKLQEADKIRAIHIEVEAKHSIKALQALSKHFGKRNSVLPGGRRM